MKAPRAPAHVKHGNPFLKEKVHDPYRSDMKLREATRCPQCGARYRNGRWTWAETPSQALTAQLCPACRRINDHYPAGELVISGAYAASHRDEIVARARHVEGLERTEHPLHRIMAVDQRDNEVVITTTDVHLPHQIAHALKDAYGGTTQVHYDLEGYFTRARWERED